MSADDDDTDKISVLLDVREVGIPILVVLRLDAEVYQVRLNVAGARDLRDKLGLVLKKLGSA